jgi:hypothetical protein
MGCHDAPEHADGEKKGLVGKIKYLYEDEKQRISEKGIGGALGTFTATYAFFNFLRWSHARLTHS